MDNYSLAKMLSSDRQLEMQIFTHLKLGPSTTRRPTTSSG